MLWLSTEIGQKSSKMVQKDLMLVLTQRRSDGTEKKSKAADAYWLKAAITDWLEKCSEPDSETRKRASCFYCCPLQKERAQYVAKTSFLKHI